MYLGQCIESNSTHICNSTLTICTFLAWKLSTKHSYVGVTLFRAGNYEHQLHQGSILHQGKLCFGVRIFHPRMKNENRNHTLQFSTFAGGDFHCPIRPRGKQFLNFWLILLPGSKWLNCECQDGHKGLKTESQLAKSGWVAGSTSCKRCELMIFPTENLGNFGKNPAMQTALPCEFLACRKCEPLAHAAGSPLPCTDPNVYRLYCFWTFQNRLIPCTLPRSPYQAHQHDSKLGRLT